MRRLLTAVAILAVLVPAGLVGQAAPRPGDRIRVRTADGATVSGTLGPTSEESVRVLNGNGETQAIPRAFIVEVERSAGRQREFGKYFVRTIGVTAGIGGVLYAAVPPCEADPCWFTNDSRVENFMGGALLGAIIGTPIAFIVGAVKRERWEPIALPGAQAATVSLWPTLTRGVGVAGSISFRGP